MKIKLLVKISLIIFSIIVIVIFIAGFFSQTNNNPGKSIKLISANTTKTSNTDNPITLKSFSVAEVANHNTPLDCWAIVNNKVYDMSNYANKHPGGDSAITSFCGKDMTPAFENQHSNSKKANSLLDSFYIGNLS